MLARKISLAKWKAKDYLTPDEISADVITSCLRTQEDSMSWWRCLEVRDDVAEVVLALASGMNNLDKIDIVVVPDEIFQPLSGRIRQRTGTSRVEDLNSRHVDLIDLDVERLLNIARTLAPIIRAGTRVFPFPRWEVSSLLRTALEKNRLALQHLAPKLQEALMAEAS